jgi:cytochrome c oxidase accessory protein FixG
MRELAGQVQNLALGPWEAFWLVFYSFATYGNAGFMREQVCKYMCPYARFQSAMFDKDTLIISYDRERGEPRGGRQKSTDPKVAGLGDCISCTLCVQVCPTGIDIRDGLQYECIACAACIDVCDQVMDKMEYPRGLIRFTTEHALKHKQTHVLRPRIFVYGALLLVIVSSTLWSMTHRVPLRADLIRDRNALYRELPGDLIENVYTLKITNMDSAAHQYEFVLPMGTEAEIDTSRPLSLQAEEVAGVSVRIRLPRSAGQGVQNLELLLRAEDDPSIQKTIQAKVLLPVNIGSK